MIANHGKVNSPVDVACFTSELTAGGAQRAMVKLVNGFAGRGLRVDLVLADKRGPHLSEVEKTVRVVDLESRRVAQSIAPLSKYLRRERPRALISSLTHANLAAIAARSMAGAETRLAVVEQNTVSAVNSELKRDSLLPVLVRRGYPRADHVIAVSEGVANDLVTNLAVPTEKLTVISNPVVDNNLLKLASETPGHPWFDDTRVPVFVAAGRLTRQKDFPTLLRAFQKLRQTRPARLVIIGEGEERLQLQKLVGQLALMDHVAMPGFVANPYSLMSRGAAFVLSSLWEGLPTVLIEAMACGCPIVATDCPSGPREILDEGRFGKLVLPGDFSALCMAMQDVLQQRPAPSVLRQRARKYSVDQVVDSYASLLGLVEVKELALPA